MTDAKAASTSRRAVVLSVVIGAFVLMQVMLVAVAKVDTLYMSTWPNTDPSPDFWGSCDIGQTFVSSSPNIGRIDLFFGTHGRAASYRIGFELFEAGAPRTLLAVFRASKPRPCGTTCSTNSASPRSGGRAGRSFSSASLPPMRRPPMPWPSG